jgi:pyruvate ferredoxin oxidoreductase beta subunit
MVEGGRGEFVHTYIPKRMPVEEYLKLRGRFRHLFEPTVQTEAIAHIQARVNAYWQEVKKMGTAF